MKQEIEKKKICGLFLDYKVTNLGEQHPKCGDSVIFARGGMFTNAAFI